MARPRGEIRAVIAAKFIELGSGGAGVSVRTLAEAAQVGYQAALNTVMNMERAEEVEKVGREKRAGSLHWEHLFALKEPPPPPDAEPGIDTLTQVMRAFPACTDA